MMPEDMYERHNQELREDRREYAEFCVKEFAKKVRQVIDTEIPKGGFQATDCARLHHNICKRLGL